MLEIIDNTNLGEIIVAFPQPKNPDALKIPLPFVTTLALK